LTLSGVARCRVSEAETLRRLAQARRETGTTAGVLSRSSILSPVGRITLSLRGDGGTALALQVKPTLHASRSAQGGSWRSENIGADTFGAWERHGTSEVGKAAVKARPALWKRSGEAGKHPGR
jgi:hypothetical protein